LATALLSSAVTWPAQQTFKIERLQRNRPDFEDRFMRERESSEYPRFRQINVHRKGEESISCYRSGLSFARQVADCVQSSSDTKRHVLYDDEDIWIVDDSFGGGGMREDLAIRNGSKWDTAGLLNSHLFDKRSKKLIGKRKTLKLTDESISGCFFSILRTLLHAYWKASPATMSKENYKLSTTDLAHRETKTCSSAGSIIKTRKRIPGRMVKTAGAKIKCKAQAGL